MISRVQGFVRAARRTPSWKWLTRRRTCSQSRKISAAYLSYKFKGRHIWFVILSTQRLNAITEAQRSATRRYAQTTWQKSWQKLQKVALITNYLSKCESLKDHSRILPLDDIGHKALKTYFQRHPVPIMTLTYQKQFKIIFLCAVVVVRRGEAYAQQVLQQNRKIIESMQGNSLQKSQFETSPLKKVCKGH